MSTSRLPQQLLLTVTLTACVASLLVHSKAWSREWTDATGTHKVEADYAGCREDTVVLKKRDGKTISVPLGKLAESDQQFVRTTLAGIIAQDVGTTSRVSESNTTPWVMVFPETHVSRAGQLEIALMMLRLYRDHGARHIALEGYVKGTPVDATWFHKMPARRQLKQRVAVRLLEEGEISAAETMALLFPETSLHRIEIAEEYDVDRKGAGAGPVVYLYNIALRTLKPSDVAKVNKLAQDKKLKEAIDYVIKANKWTAEKYRLLRAEDEKVVQAEDFVKLADAIEAKANEVGYRPDAKEAEMMRSFRGFFSARHKASNTMVSETAAIAQRFPKAAILMCVGAAHTNGVVERLDNTSLGYAIINPHSLTHKVGHMSLNAFDRKGHKWSVDVNKLGGLLDGRKNAQDQIKPPPVISEQWLQAKCALYTLADIIAERALGGTRDARPPFGLNAEQLDLGAARVDPASMQLIADNVVFKVLVFNGLVKDRRPGDETNDERWRTLWCRAKWFGGDPRMTPDEEYQGDVELERLLKERLADVKREPSRDISAEGPGDPGGPRNPVDAAQPEDPEGSERKGVTPPARVSSETIAKFSGDQAALLQSSI